MNLPPSLVAFAQKVLDYLEPDIRRQAGAVYAQLVNQARDPWLYREAGVPDTVDGRFEMLVLHMFLFLFRLRQESDYGRKYPPFEKEMIELMFDDMDQNLREMGVGDMSVGKKVNIMAEALYGRFQAYDDALESKEEVNAALRRNVYGTLEEDEVDEDAVEQLQLYLGLLLNHFRRMNADEMVTGVREIPTPKALVKQHERANDV